MADARILIVEDEGIEALDLQHRLTGLGYTAPDIVSSGEEAVIKAEETQPDLILMDIMLHGGMDGVTAAGRIHARFDIPVIFLTAYADDDTLRRAKATEPYGYLVKPFKEKDLHISIDMALYKHKMERKLKESEKWLSTTLSSIGDAVIATDKNELITFMNPVAEGLTGWKLENAVHKKLTEVFTVINMDTRKPVENPIARVIREGVAVGLANHTILIARDGTEMPIDDSAAPIRDDRGNIIGLVLVFRDITERKRAEEEIRKVNAELELRVFERTAELEAANKELEAFAYSVSHDLRAPLRAVDGFTRMLLDKYEPRLDAEGKRICSVISESAREMGKLIDDLLSFSRVGRTALRPSAVDMATLAKAVFLEVTNPGDRERIDFHVGPLPSVVGDPTLIRLVWMNLLSNTVKFSSKKERAVIEVGAEQRDGECVYSVRDNGAGFDMRYVNKLFGVFQRLHSTKEFDGTGVGLAIVQRIILRHGGRVWAEGETGKGATFHFTFKQGA
jgi:PAS domain S-box-containing protein